MICGYCGKKVDPKGGETYFASLVAGGFQAYCSTACGDKQVKKSKELLKGAYQEVNKEIEQKKEEVVEKELKKTGVDDIFE